MYTNIYLHIYIHIMYWNIYIQYIYIYNIYIYTLTAAIKEKTRPSQTCRCSQQCAHIPRILYVYMYVQICMYTIYRLHVHIICIYCSNVSTLPASCMYVCMCVCVCVCTRYIYGVATISRLLKIIGLFCIDSSLL